ncbi:putative regulatory protein NPR1 isoform X1 [Iris pallida]|uniref:Regulatory protein NPR1 isoform X1 n=1 Tax=Iris pallida TaxID=29817 RepID=A0AAX6FB45_IRIPA|nr:putative regulatory protein NPR1 isoform X1 [Iris pallida]
MEDSINSCISMEAFFDSSSSSPNHHPADVEALRRLSDSLSSLLLLSPSDSFSDLTIAVQSTDSPRDLAVHRCILSARSPFFRRLLLLPDAAERLDLGEVLLGFDVGFDALVLVMGYLYSGKVGPLPRGVCECADEDCRHVACRPAVEFMSQVLFAASVFEISELVSLFQRHLLGILEKVTIDNLPMILSVANMCNNACPRLYAKCFEIVVTSNLDAVTLEKSLPPNIVESVMDSRSVLGLQGPEITSFPSNHVMNIYKALDSDDIQLVEWLLEEGHTTLDEACALHYAIAHCNTKITAKLLNLGLADVNHINLRGYTVLHIAAMQKEPEIIMSLLTKGARPSDLTSDGRKAIQISKRLTRAVDYCRPAEQGKASSKDRLCIDILEQAETKDPFLKEDSVSVPMAASDLLQELLYLENRVGLAKLLYPVEAKVAMDNAHVDGTLEFSLSPTSDITTGNQRTAVILNELPFKIKEEHISRMRALARTVELGMRYFPRCAEVLSKIMDDDYSDLSYPEQNTTEGRKQRYLELQDEMKKAFDEDKQKLDGSVFSSKSSKLPGRIRTKSARKC